MARVGIFGGTFNPPHIGHLVLAQEAITQLGLERVILMPACAPPNKEVPRDPGAEERLTLCMLATEDDARFEVSDIEVERGGTSFTVETLRTLRASAPGDELTLILGGDVAQGFPTWREPEEIMSLARIAVAERDGIGHGAVMEALGPLTDDPQIDFFEMVRVDVSSSMIRERLSADEPIRYLVPDAVREEIERNGWYT